TTLSTTDGLTVTGTLRVEGLAGNEEGISAINGPVTIASTSVLRIEGASAVPARLQVTSTDFTNLGKIEIVSTSAEADVMATLQMKGESILENASGGTIDLGADGIADSLVELDGSVINHGTVLVQRRGFLNGTHAETPGRFTNFNTLTVEQGAALTHDNGIYVHAVGASISNEGEIVFVHTVDIDGVLSAIGTMSFLGTVNSGRDGTGFLLVPEGKTAVIHGATVNAAVVVAGTLHVKGFEGSPDLIAIINGSLTTTKTSMLRIEGAPAAPALLQVATGFTNLGKIELVSTSAEADVMATLQMKDESILENASGATIDLGADGIAGSLVELNGYVVNLGTVIVRRRGFFNGIHAETPARFTNFNALSVEQGAVLTHDNGVYVHGAGASISNEGEILFAHNVEIAGVFSAAGAMSFLGTINAGDGATGSLVVTEGSTVDATGATVNVDVAIEGTFEVTGVVGSPDLKTVINGAVTTASTSVLRVTGADQADGKLEIAQGFSNLGIIELKSLPLDPTEGLATLRVMNGVLENSSTGTIQLVDSQPDAFRLYLHAALLNNGRLTGGGLLAGPITNNGTIELLANEAVLVQTSFAQSSSGTLEIHVDGASREFEPVAIVGTAALDGMLRVRLAADFSPEDAQEITLLTYASKSGSFSTSIVGLPDGTNAAIVANNTSATVTFSVTTPVVFWDGGGFTSNWIEALNWSTDVVPTSEDRVEIHGESDLVVVIAGIDVTVRSLLVQSTLFFRNATLTTTDGFTLTGTLRVQGSVGFPEIVSSISGPITTTSTSVIRVDGAVEARAHLKLTTGFSNLGRIELESASAELADSAVLQVMSGTLENEAGGTIDLGADGVAGSFVEIDGELINRGTIEVKRIAALGGQFAVAGSALTNFGSITVLSGARLRLLGATYVHGAGSSFSSVGAIEFFEPVELDQDLFASGSITFATTVEPGKNDTAGLVVPQGATVTLLSASINVPVAVAGILEAVSSSEPSVINAPLTTTSASVIRVASSPGNAAHLKLVTGFVNLGRIELKSTSDQITNSAVLQVMSGALENEAGRTIDLGADGVAGSFVEIDGEFVNRGTVEVKRLASIGGQFAVVASPVGNSGSISVLPGAQLRLIQATYVHDAEGSITNQGEVEFGDVVGLNVDLLASGQMTFFDTVEPGPETTGRLVVSQGATVTLAGATVNTVLAVAGTLEATRTSVINGALTTAPTSILRVSAPDGASAVLEVAQGFINLGTIQLRFETPAPGQGTSTLRVISGVLTNNGVVTGSGTLSGTVSNNGTIRVGTAVSLSVQGMFTQSSTGTLEVNITGPDTATLKPLEVSSTADLNGTLRIVLAPGFVPPTGSAFVILKAADITGDFTTYTGLSIPGGGTFDPLFNAQNTELRLEVLEAVPTIIWDGGGNDTSWHNPLNWNLDRLPVITDLVVIDLPGAVVEHSQNTTKVRAIQSTQHLVISGGYLQFHEDSTLKNLTMLGGAIAGFEDNGITDLTAEITGLLTWKGGDLGGDIGSEGAFDVGSLNDDPATPRLRIEPGSVKRLFVTLTLYGHGLITAEDFFVGTPVATPGGKLEVFGILELQNSGDIRGVFETTTEIEEMPLLVNHGIVRKSGTGESSIQLLPYNTAAGSLTEVLAGTLSLLLFESPLPSELAAGSFAISPGATLLFGEGGHKFGTDSTIQGGGSLVVEGGEVRISGAYNLTGKTTVRQDATRTAARLRFDAAPATRQLAEFEIQGGNVSVSGSVVIPTLTISGGALTTALTNTDGVTTPASVKISGFLLWRGGNLGGDLITGGVFEVGVSNDGPTTPRLRIENGSPKRLYSPLTIYGRAVLAADDFMLREPVIGIGGRLIVRGEMELQGTADIGATFLTSRSMEDSPLVDVHGKFSKTGSGESRIDAPYDSKAGATTEVLAGTLALLNFQGDERPSQIEAGSFAISQGATLLFGEGSHHFGTDSTIQGAGSLIVEGGEVKISGVYNLTGKTTVRQDATRTSARLQFDAAPATRQLAEFEIQGGHVSTAGNVFITKLTMSGGFFTTVGSVKVSESLLWQGGDLGGDFAPTSGAFEVGGQADGPTTTRLRIESGTAKRLLSALTLYGRGVIDTEDFRVATPVVGVGGELVVRGVLELQGMGDIGASFLSGATSQVSPHVIVHGKLLKTGSGESRIEAPYDSKAGAITEIQAGTLALLNFEGTLRPSDVEGGSFVVSFGATVLFGEGSHNFRAASTIQGAGNVIFEGGAVSIAGTYNVTGTTTIRQNAARTATTVEFISTPQIATLQVQAGTMTLRNGAAPGNLTMTGGTIAIAGGSITSANPISITAGTLQGVGTIEASVSNNGVLKPGTSPGSLVIEGDFTQTSTGTLEIELEGATPGTEFDVLQITGQATLSGKLLVVRATGFFPAADGRFEFMTYALRTGDFLEFEGLDFPGGQLTPRPELLEYALVSDSAPQALDDQVTTLEDTASAAFNVLANDIDPGDVLTVLTFGQPSRGTVVQTLPGTFIYTPQPNTFGLDSFTYVVQDLEGNTDSGQVLISVQAVNDPPIAVDDTASTEQNVAVNVAVLANDIEVDGNTLTIQSFAAPANGAVTDNGNGTLRYTPASGFTGNDSFSYTAADPSGASSSATVTVTVGSHEEAERTRAIRDQLNDGFEDLFPQFPNYSDLFDFSNSSRPDMNPPVVSEDLNNLFSLGDELEDLDPPQLPELFTIRDLIEALEALGFEVLEIEGGYSDATHSIPDTPLAGDLILLRYQKTFADFHGSAPFDDSTGALLEALNPSANLDGNLDYDADLTLDVFIGLDSEVAAGGFFLLGQSALRLELAVTGTLGATFPVPLGDLALSIEGSAAVDLTVEVGGNVEDHRYRVTDIIGDPNLFLVPDVDGTASIDLAVAVTDAGEPTSITFGLLWDLTVEDGEVTDVHEEIVCPEDELFAEAVISLLAEGFGELGDPALLRLNGLGIPLTEGAPGAHTPDGLLIGQDGEQPVWFAQVTQYLEQMFSLLDGTGRGEGAHYTLGDELLGSAELRRELDLAGAGITIGVISDGADGLEDARQSGDLPSDPQIVHPTLSGTGAEGIAMMEIVHDVAPSARLRYVGIAGNHAADGLIINAVDAFITGVRWLVEVQGATVVVDDMGFFDEPFFGEGRVGEVIRDLMARFPHVVFVTSAGNYAQSHAGATFQKTLHRFAGEVTSRNIHQFSSDSNFIQAFVNQDGTYQASLHWTDPTETFRLLLVNPATNKVVDVSSPTSDTSAVLDVDARGDERTFGFAIERMGTNFPATSPFFRLIGRDMTFFTQPRGSIVGGHKIVDGMIVVGAIRADQPGLNVPSAKSSQGPSLVYIDGSLAERQTLTVLGISDVSVSGAGGFSRPFTGTSAAAPHVAGIAALLQELYRREFVDFASAAQIKNALEVSAIDLGTPGYDNATGYGRVDAFGAAAELLTT
ncbi:MAG TPA: tandem-95 repeat protein, partial [Terriglobia bacterium]|nr:tandem-95 repeat protein [Terriglobia bacterium]